MTKTAQKTQEQNGTAVQEIDETTAQKIIAAAEKKRIAAFLEAYQALCQEHGYQLVPAVQLEVRKI
jgi:uncharacterized protein YqiB (DUF1249 family)